MKTEKQEAKMVSSDSRFFTNEGKRIVSVSTRLYSKI